MSDTDIEDRIAALFHLKFEEAQQLSAPPPCLSALGEEYHEQCEIEGDPDRPAADRAAAGRRADEVTDLINVAKPQTLRDCVLKLHVAVNNIAVTDRADDVTSLTMVADFLERLVGD